MKISIDLDDSFDNDTSSSMKKRDIKSTQKLLEKQANNFKDFSLSNKVHKSDNN